MTSTPLLFRRAAALRAAMAQGRGTPEELAEAELWAGTLPETEQAYEEEIRRLTEQVQDLTDHLESARRTVGEQQQEISALRLQLPHPDRVPEAMPSCIDRVGTTPSVPLVVQADTSGGEPRG